MNFLLRRWVEWKGRRRGAQVIVFDGGAEIERMRAFFRGAVSGALLAGVTFALAAPNGVAPALLEEMERRQALVEESSRRVEQSMQLAEMCLGTAARMEHTLSAYRTLLAEP